MKNIAFYHGYGGDPSHILNNYLRHIGANRIHSPKIDYDEEWEYDRCQYLFYDECSKIKEKNIDIIIGHSLGGYLAFELAGYLSKDLILINPGIDRSKTLLDITYFDIEPKRDFKRIDIFLGKKDKVIKNKFTIDYIRKNKIKANIYLFDEMDHGFFLSDFEEMVQMSDILSNIYK